MTAVDKEEQERAPLADRVKAARQDDVPAGDPPQAAQTVTLPAETWQHVRRLAELGEQVEAGKYKPAAELDAALKQVEQLRDALLAHMQQQPAPAVEKQAAPAVPIQAAWAAALRQARPARR